MRCEAIEPQPLPYGYTNEPTRLGAVVTKSYRGPDAERRRAREAAALRALHGRLPVPRLVSSGSRDGRLRADFVAGTHGKDLIAAGHMKDVLRACGHTLRAIHSTDLRLVPEPLRETAPEPGQVLVHGDYGPNNVLLDARAGHVTAVLDWEWAHLGDPVEDLAWCEWVVRMYHAKDVSALDDLFDAYGGRPAWPARHRAMLAQCTDLVTFWESWQPHSERTRLRHRQLAQTRLWTE